MTDLFSNARPAVQELAKDMYLLCNFVDSAPLLQTIQAIIKTAPLRKMMTPNGHKTGIALTNCGDYGWVSDISGYRYSKTDPLTGLVWPKIPHLFSELASQAAAKVGFNNFISDACLINDYPIGSKLNAHQDKNERDFNWPIVSVSLGLKATFQNFGDARTNKPNEIELYDGDVMVWGGASRLAYHGVKTIKADPLMPKLDRRFNLTFRCAG
jgi:DNA oxidative demethylase